MRSRVMIRDADFMQDAAIIVEMLLMIDDVEMARRPLQILNYWTMPFETSLCGWASVFLREPHGANFLENDIRDVIEESG